MAVDETVGTRAGLRETALDALRKQQVENAEQSAKWELERSEQSAKSLVADVWRWLKIAVDPREVQFTSENGVRAFVVVDGVRFHDSGDHRYGTSMSLACDACGYGAWAETLTNGWTALGKLYVRRDDAGKLCQNCRDEAIPCARCHGQRVRNEEGDLVCADAACQPAARQRERPPTVDEQFLSAFRAWLAVNAPTCQCGGLEL